MLERDALGHCVNNVFLLDVPAGFKVFTKNFLELFFAKLRGLMNVKTTFFSKNGPRNIVYSVFKL